MEEFIYEDKIVNIDSECATFYGVKYPISCISCVFVSKRKREVNNPNSILFTCAFALVGGLTVFWAVLAAIAHLKGISGSLILDGGVMLSVISLACAALARSNNRKRKHEDPFTYDLIVETYAGANAAMASKDEDYVRLVCETMERAMAQRRECSSDSGTTTRSRKS